MHRVDIPNEKAIDTMAAAVHVIPETELQFVLSTTEATPRCTMTISHPGGNITEHVAFKVKTTQPRRYLVRPNQGLIPPGGSETIQIILVEKDKSSLLESYQRLGQSALDHSKDKFLVQSCTVPASFSEQFQAGDAGYDALSVLWSTVTSSGSSTAVANKKLHVRHTAEGTDGNSGSEQMPKHETPMAAMENMSQAQLLGEVTTLRRKYDELVAFSVNLTAERDILNNTLEQTKRDLNREVNRNASTDNRGAGGTALAGPKPAAVSYFPIVVAAMLFLLVGVQLEQMEKVGFLTMLPVIGGMFEKAAKVVVAEVEPEL